MPRRLIPFVEDQYYHIYNRGVNRERIFFEQGNYLLFLRGLKKYICPQAEIIAYCLMPNHYHVLVRVKPVQVLEVSLVGTLKVSLEKTSEVPSPLTPLSRAIKNFLIAYVKSINLRYSRVGPLFQGQFKAKPIQTFDYLLTLCIYIHANPVKDGLVAEIKDWSYSNYLEWLGERKGSLFTPEFVQENFDSPADYEKLVMDYLKSRDLPDDIRRYLNSLDE